MSITTLGGNSTKSGFIRIFTGAVLSIACFSPSISNAQAKEPGWVSSSLPKQGSGNEQGTMKAKWKAQPFDHKVFIENKGQFDAELEGLKNKNKQKVLFQATLEGDVKAYFMPNGVFYRKIDFVNADGKEVEGEKDKKKKGMDPDEELTPVVHRMGVLWENSNPDVTVEAGGEQNYFESFGLNKTVTVKANLFKKLTYRNLYPGIDVVYEFPDGDKVGIKYTVIVHPGADLSQVKLKYLGATDMKVTELGNVKVSCQLSDDFTDHKPVSSYSEGGNAQVVYSVSGNEESFVVKGDYDKSKTLVIDPWTTTGINADFTYANSGYDLDYDNAGNVYVAGSYDPYQIVKFNAAGTKVWTIAVFSADNTNSGVDKQYWGDFAVDKNTSVLYAGEGFNVAGAWAEKYNPSGTKIGTYGGTNNFREMWRMEFNACKDQIAIGGGGTNPSTDAQVAVLDTTMATLTPQNPLGATGAGHDVCIMAMDPVGSEVYMAVVESSFSGQSSFDDNVLFGVPLPGLTPVNMGPVSDGYNFQEAISPTYVGPGADYTNGMNGMAASPGFLYTYDGATLKKWNKGSGAFLGSTPVGGSSFTHGGLAADGCDDIYVGNGSNVSTFSPALTNTSNTAVSGTVYAIKLGLNDANLYVCGDGFVEELTNPISTVVSTTVITNATCGLCNGSAQASLTICGSPPGGISYNWQPGGQTTQTATGLCAGTYTVSMSIGCGQTFQATAVIPPSSPPVTTVSPSTSICSGGSTVLTAGGASTYTWAPNIGLSATTGTSVTANPVSTQTYTVVGTDPGGCNSQATVTVTVNPLPTVTAAPPTSTICTGSSTTLTAGGAVTYTWQPGALSGSSVTVSPGGNTTYTVTGTDGNGCTNTATATVNVNPLPVVTVSPSTSICSGQSATLNAGGAVTYLWNTGATTTSITVSPASTTSYTVTGTDANGCTNTASATITVNPTPVVTVAPPTSTICSGNSATLTASGAASYTWQPGALSGASITVSPGSNTTYTIVGSNGGCNDTVTYMITVNPTPVISVTPASPGICPGGDVLLTASGAGVGGTYSWNTGQTNDTLTVGPASTTTYTVTGTNTGCSAQAIVTVSVGALTVTATATSSALCTGGSTTLNGAGAATYTWNPGALSGASVVVTPAVTTTYTVTGTSGSGCSAKDSITITVNPTPTISAISGAGSLCPGDTTHSTVNVTGSGTSPYTYSWTTGGTYDSAYMGPGSYTVTITDANGCSSTASVTIPVKTITVTATAASPSICTGDSTQLNASGATNYTWKPGTGLNNVSDNPADASPPVGSTTYTVVGTSGTCVDSAFVTLTVNATPVVTASASSGGSICSGMADTLTASGASTYTWLGGTTPTTGSPVTASPSTNTTYTVIGTSAAGCPDSVMVSVTVNPSPTITVTPSGNDTVCNGTSATLTANGAANYVWSTGATTSSVTVIPGTNPTVYTVVGVNGTCTDTVKDSVFIYAPLTLTMKYDSICSGKSVTVSAVVGGGKPVYTYSWDNGLGTGAGPFVVSPTSSTYYACTVTDACGTLKDSALVFVYPSPSALFTASPNPVLGGEYVAFVNSHSGATSWLWTFGNGTTSVDSFPYYQYDIPGSYLATLVVKNQFGCVDSSSDTIHVTEAITVPNVFTPNGDGKNDVFHVTAGGMKEYDIEIFNRWGEKVFEANSPNIDWTGKSQSGVEESDGTYYYILKATDYDNKNYNLQGYLQLIRGSGN